MVNLTKCKATLSLDPHTYEKAKNTYDSVSEKVDQLLEESLDMQNVDDIEILKKEKTKLEEKIEDQKEVISQEQAELESLNEQLNVVNSKIERLEKEKEERKEELERFKKVSFNKADDWNKPDDINDYWEEELDKDNEELWRIMNKRG